MFSLTFSCRYNNPTDFKNANNYLTPSPDWSFKPSNLPVSTTPPLNETELSSIAFDLWTEIGSEFLIKNNINNWVHCTPNGGSLVDMRTGPMVCNVTKIIVEGVCEDKVPFMFEKHSPAVGLFSLSGLYYYLYTKGQSSWSVSDPCGATGENHLKSVPNPAGWIYLRHKEPVNPQVSMILDARNTASKWKIYGE